VKSKSDIGIRFGENLRRCRKRADLSQERFAVLAGLHRVEVGHLENGRSRPRIDTLVKLACTLGVPTDELLDGIDWVPGETEPGSLRVVARVVSIGAMAED
jgi:transcriptional regulator with XRE-family HTH domain